MVGTVVFAPLFSFMVLLFAGIWYIVSHDYGPPLLTVIVDGVTVSTPDMLFEDVYECNKFANAIERGS